MTRINEKVYEISTKVDVRVDYTGSVPNAEIITYIIKKPRWFPFVGDFYSYHIYQIIPYVKKSDMHDRNRTNKLLKTIACRDKKLAKKYIRENT